nr:hypothetical protein 1 [Riboviria sp.]
MLYSHATRATLRLFWRLWCYGWTILSFPIWWYCLTHLLRGPGEFVKWDSMLSGKVRSYLVETLPHWLCDMYGVTKPVPTYVGWMSGSLSYFFGVTTALPYLSLCLCVLFALFCCFGPTPNRVQAQELQRALESVESDVVSPPSLSTARVQTVGKRRGVDKTMQTPQRGIHSTSSVPPKMADTAGKKKTTPKKHAAKATKRTVVQNRITDSGDLKCGDGSISGHKTDIPVPSGTRGDCGLNIANPTDGSLPIVTRQSVAQCEPTLSNRPNAKPRAKAVGVPTDSRIDRSSSSGRPRTSPGTAIVVWTEPAKAACSGESSRLSKRSESSEKPISRSHRLERTLVSPSARRSSMPPDRVMLVSNNTTLYPGQH